MREGFYFPHFQDARRDIKIMRLRRDLGIEGYGIYFMLLEILREQPNHKFPLQDIDILAHEIQTTRAKIEVVIANYELFETEKSDDGKLFFSPKLITYLLPYLQKKENAKLANLKSQASRKQKMQKQLSLLDSTLQDNKSVKLSEVDSLSQIKEKEKKRKEIKEEETTTEEICSSSFFKNEDIKKWIIEKSKDKINPSAYAAVMVQKIKDKEPTVIAELELWVKEQKKNLFIKQCTEIEGKEILTSQGSKRITRAIYEDNEPTTPYTLYFTDGQSTKVISLEQLTFCDEGDI